jgi:hypothetical protein
MGLWLVRRFERGEEEGGVMWRGGFGFFGLTDDDTRCVFLLFNLNGAD